MRPSLALIPWMVLSFGALACDEDAEPAPTASSPEEATPSEPAPVDEPPESSGDAESDTIEPEPEPLSPEQIAHNEARERRAGRPLPFASVVISLTEHDPELAERIAAELDGEVRDQIAEGLYWVLLPEVSSPEALPAVKVAAEAHPEVQFALPGWETANDPIPNETFREGSVTEEADGRGGQP